MALSPRDTGKQQEWDQHMRKYAALIVSIIATVALLHSAHGASQEKQCSSRSACKAECEKTKRKIRQLQEKMRQGYSAAQGYRMEAELRRLRARRATLCR
jgi:hypothetical protein